MELLWSQLKKNVTERASREEGLAISLSLVRTVDFLRNPFTFSSSLASVFASSVKIPRGFLYSTLRRCEFKQRGGAMLVGKSKHAVAFAARNNKARERFVFEMEEKVGGGERRGRENKGRDRFKRRRTAFRHTTAHLVRCSL